MADLLETIDACDGEVREESFLEEDLSALDLGHVEFEDCTFEGCAFAEMQASRISFDRCTFVSCDFSNARLGISFWRDCRVTESRLVGCDLHQSFFVRDVFADCACSYANFNESKLEYVTMQGCNLHEASLSQMRVKRLKLEACNLTRAELFRTRLRDVDLSSCTIQALRTSDTFVELRGAKIGLDQAPDIIGLLGVKLV